MKFEFMEVCQTLINSSKCIVTCQTNEYSKISRLTLWHCFQLEFFASEFFALEFFAKFQLEFFAHLNYLE